MLVMLLAILASLKVNIGFNLTVCEGVMGFNKISVTSEIRINSLRAGLDVTLIGNHVIQLTPTHILISITNGGFGG